MTTILNNSYWNNISSIDFYDNLLSIEQENEEIDQQKQIQISSTSHLSNLICFVCGAPAIGYNFNQITCEPCKAFFRRNAFKDLTRMKCRFIGSCAINIQTRRNCKYCRLKKCFAINMRKDWIRTEEEIEMRQLQKLAKEQKKLNQLTNDQQFLLHLPIVVRKKRHLMIEQKTLIKSIHTQTLFSSNHNLSDNDRIILNNITNIYQLIADQTDGFHINKCTISTSLIEFLNEESDMHESLITFYQQIPDFSNLHIDDRVLLIKCNLINIVHLHYILIQNFYESPLMGLYMSKWISADFHNQMSRTRRYFDRFIEHQLILKLALVVLIFSINISTPRGINELDNYINKIHIYKIQEFYTSILWRYLNIIYDENEAIRSMEIIITQILHYQTLMDIMTEIIQRETTNHTVHQLISSLFRLT